MRDRLIGLIKKIVHPYFAQAIADEVLEDGWVRLPCKVGDTVYQPSYKFTKCSAYDYAPRFIEDSSCCGCGAKCDSVKEPYIYEGTVVSIRITKEQNFLDVSFQEKFDSSSFILGKTVFLTREEAEQALLKP